MEGVPHVGLPAPTPPPVGAGVGRAGQGGISGGHINQERQGFEGTVRGKG